MTIVKDILQDLKDKHLWPVALILVIGIVAAPMLLAKPAEPTTSAAVPPAVADEDGPQVALTRASTTGFARPPRVNDERLDPFASRAKKSSLKDEADKLAGGADDVINGDGGGSSDPGPGGPTDPEPDSPEPDTEPEVKTETDDLLSILVTNGSDQDAEPVQVSDIRTLSPLVDKDDPFLVYVGKTSDNRASFLVSADVTVSGDGDCSPSPTDCRTLTLGIGQTAEFTLVSDQSKKTSLTVLDIERKAVPIDDGTASSDPAVAQAEQARKAGAKALKSVLGDEEVVKALVKQKIKIRS